MIPISTEKVLRATLQALLRGGYLASGSDVTKLESIPNNASDQDISDVLDTISFGGLVSNLGELSSNTDVNVFVDADDNSSAVAPNYFRVAEDQSTAPVTDQNNELFTVGRELVGITDTAVVARVGPRISLITGTHTGQLNLGGNSTNAYGILTGGPKALKGDANGFSIYSLQSAEWHVANNISYLNHTKANVRGGWSSLNTQAQFNVGDYTATESLAIEVETSGSAVDHFNIRPTSSNGRKIFVRGNNAGDYDIHFAVGGKLDETWGDPDNFYNSTALIVAPLIEDNRQVLYLYDRKVNRSGGEVFTIRAEDTTHSYYLMRVYKAATPLFNIDSTGDVNIGSGNTYNTSGADLAEHVKTDTDYAPGTVLCIEDGLYQASKDYAQSNVAGVVSTNPGVLLGGKHLFDISKMTALPTPLSKGATDKIVLPGNDWVAMIGEFVRLGEHEYIAVKNVTNDEAYTYVELERKADLNGQTVYGNIARQIHTARLSFCGTVPVLCSTEAGDIHGNGEILVSGPDGHAVVSRDPKPGTIIGKAQGKLIGNGEGVVKGMVETLVNLQ